MDLVDAIGQFQELALAEGTRRYLGMAPDLSIDAEEIEAARDLRAAADAMRDIVTTCWCHCHKLT